MSLAVGLHFPCREDKSPLTPRGFHDASFADPSGWPLVGIPTGAISGIDCLDIDPGAWPWPDFYRLPETRTHITRRGYHLFFRHAEGLRSSAGRVHHGIDIRADGGYVIDWSREGFTVLWPDLIVEWPEWLLEKAKSQTHPKRELAKLKGHDGGDGHQESKATIARLQSDFLQLDVTDYQGHDDWFRLMCACHSAGIERDVFISWSVGDPAYAGDSEIIERRWASLTRGYSGAAVLRKELKQAGITSKGNGGREGIVRGEHPLTASMTASTTYAPVPTANLQHRVTAIIRKAEFASGANREPCLFWAACRLGEIIGEGKLKPSVAQSLLEGACRRNGLWRDDGAEACRRTITNGFDRIEQRMMENSDVARTLLRSGG